MWDVQLADMTAAHIEALFAHEQELAAHHMIAFTRAQHPLSRDMFQQHWERLLADATVCTKVVVTPGGVAGYVTRFLRLGVPEVAYRLGQAHWGAGIATQAVAMLLDAVPERPLFARVATDNIGSRRVLEKNGFVQEATARAYAEARGCEVDEFILRLGPLGP